MLASILFMSGCGFHLKGTSITSLTGSQIVVDSSEDLLPVEKRLENYLLSLGAKLKSSEGSFDRIALVSQRSQKRALLLDSAGRATENALKIELLVEFQLFDKQKNQLLDPVKHRYSETRSYVYDNTQLLAMKNYEQELTQQMQQEMIVKIAQTLNALRLKEFSRAD